MATTTRRKDRTMPQAAAAPGPSLAEAQRVIADARIEEAKRLERERGDLMEAVSNNRTQLRQMDKANELTEAQGAWLDTFYPEKEKGERRTKEEIEATRKARESARKDGATES